MSFVARKCRDTTLFQGVNVSENKFTVIIGKNGCGKSNLLKNLCNQYEELFYQNYCQLKNERPQWVSAYYAESHNALIDFVVSKADTLLPSKIIACSTSPFDQFNIRGRKPEKDFSLNYYQYIGTKESTDRYSPTVSMANRAISILLQDHRVFGSRRFSAISSCLQQFNFSSLLELIIKIPEEFILLCNIVKSGDTDSLEVISSRLKFNDLINEFSEFDGIDNVLEFIEYCNILIENDSKIIIKITESGLCPLNSEPNILSAVRILLNNNIVKIQDIYSIEKVNSNSLSEDIQNQNYHSVRFSKKSSGEQCIFLLLLGVASSIEDNSLICIDEPELSLHPSWQLSFMEIIMDSFSDFKGCHFVISTHSPQILANVSSSNCEILNLETGDLTKSKNYHHRSADYQLAMLFRSPGFKNEYLINETLDILNQLAKPQSESPETLIELKRRAHLMSELKEFLSPDDPVSSLINTIESALEVIVREC